MLIYQILEEDNIVIIEPKGPLSEDDFKDLTAEVDHHLIRTGSIKGLMIQAESFPGWENFQGFISHFHFGHDHHKKIEKVALVSDSILAEIASKLVAHFVHAEVKGFDFHERDEALEWLRTSSATSN